MSELNNRTATKGKQVSRAELEAKYNSSVTTLYTIAAFTAVNLILLVANAGIYFLFSAYVPYILTFTAMVFCGMASPEYYGTDMAMLEFMPGSVFAVALAISIIIIALYALCGFLGRKHRVGWIIAGLVLFAIDTVAFFCLSELNISILMDVVFHGWAIISLIQGLVAHSKLRKLPPEEIVSEEIVAPQEADAEISAEPDDEPTETAE